MIEKFVKIMCLFAVVMVSACTTTTSRTHPTLEKELLLVETVVILPPDVEITLVTFTGEDERLTDKEAVVGKQLAENAKTILMTRGYRVIDYDLQSEIANNEEFAYTVSQVKNGFEQAGKELQQGRQIPVEESNSIKASVGAAVNIVADQSGADAVLLIRYRGFEKSGGQIAKDVGTSILVGVLTLGAVVPIQAAEGALTEAALIDGSSGDVLWTDAQVGTLSPGTTSPTMQSMPQDVDAPLDYPEMELPTAAEGSSGY